MDNNDKTKTAMRKKTPIETISTAIMVILVISMVLSTFALVGLGFSYIDGFVSGAGTATIGIVDIVYSSTSEIVQAIFLCVC